LLATAKPVKSPGFFGRAGGLGADAEKPRALFVFAEDDHLPVDSLDTGVGHQRLGILQIDFRSQGGICIPTASQDWLGVVEGNDVSIVRVGDDGLSDRLPLGRHEGDLLRECMADPLGRSLLTWTGSGQIRLWDVTGERQPTSIDGPPGIHTIRFSDDGSYFWAAASSDEEDLSDVWIWSVEDLSLRLQRRLDRINYSLPTIDPVRRQLAMGGPEEAMTRLWSLESPAGSEPIVLRRGDVVMTFWPTISSDGKWLAICDGSGLTMWPLSRPYPSVIEGGGSVAFGPGGRFLVTTREGRVALSPLEGSIPTPEHRVF